MAGESFESEKQRSRDDAAEQIFQHVKMMWDDQVSLAGTLFARRRMVSTMLAVLVGLGIFRFQLTVSAGDRWNVEEADARVIASLLTVATGLFAIGGYLVFTQRPIVRRVAVFSWGVVLRRRTHLWNLARSKTQAERDAMRIAPREPSPWASQRASDLLLADDESLDDWHELTLEQVRRNRTMRLREAYISLKKQNDRIKWRLGEALMAVVAGYALLFVAFSWYIWTMEWVWR